MFEGVSLRLTIGNALPARADKATVDIAGACDIKARRSVNVAVG